MNSLKPSNSCPKSTALACAPPPLACGPGTAPPAVAAPCGMLRRMESSAWVAHALGMTCMACGRSGSMRAGTHVHGCSRHQAKAPQALGFTPGPVHRPGQEQLNCFCNDAMAFRPASTAEPCPTQARRATPLCTAKKTISKYVCKADLVCKEDLASGFLGDGAVVRLRHPFEKEDESVHRAVDEARWRRCSEVRWGAQQCSKRCSLNTIKDENHDSCIDPKHS